MERFLPHSKVYSRASSMISNLKLFFKFCKIFGLIPVKNISLELPFQLKVTLINFETLVFLSLKWLIYLTFFAKFLSSDSTFLTVLLSSVTLIYDISLLLHLKRFFSCLAALEKFENLHIIRFESSKRTQIKWLGFILLATFLNFLVRSVSSDSIGFEEIVSQIIFVFVTFPTVSIPVTFIAMCTLLTQFFRSLDETCKQFYETLMNSNIFCLHSEDINLNKMESLRLAHSMLCESVLEFIRFFDFPVIIYLFVFFLEIFYFCFLIMFEHQKFHVLHLLKFIFNSLMILGITTKMDFLHYSVSQYIFVIL